MARVLEIWRYPVKSMQGERLVHADVTDVGLEGDRHWALRDIESGKLISAKQNRNILAAGASLEDGSLRITLPDGRQLTEDRADINAALSGWLGRSVALERAGPTSSAAYDFYADPEDETSEAIEFWTPDGTFLDAAAIHILTTGSLTALAVAHPENAWDIRRFRPSLLVEAEAEDYAEDEWVGSRLRIGDVEATVVLQTIRCGVPGRGQPDLAADGDIVRILKQDRRALLGVYAAVDVPGRIREGDPLQLIGTSE